MSDGGSCKVEVVTERYGLTPPGDRFDTIDDYLLARWTGADGRKSVGYRTLADTLNQRLLKQVYEDHDRPAFAARISGDYETLTEADDLQRGELADELAVDGIDAERLRRDLVSWGTLASHLKECLEGSKPTPDATTNWERRSIAIATERARTKAEEAVSSLASKGRLPDNAGAEVSVQVQLGCPECHTRVPYAIAIDRGYICETHR